MTTTITVPIGGYALSHCAYVEPIDGAGVTPRRSRRAVTEDDTGTTTHHDNHDINRDNNHDDNHISNHDNKDSNHGNNHDNTIPISNRLMEQVLQLGDRGVR